LGSFLAPIIFAAHDIANSFATIDSCSGFARNRYLSSRRTQSAELVQQAHPKLHIEGLPEAGQRFHAGHPWRDLRSDQSAHVQVRFLRADARRQREQRVEREQNVVHQDFQRLGKILVGLAPLLRLIAVERGDGSFELQLK
jgi:hypothetical protein